MKKAELVKACKERKVAYSGKSREQLIMSSSGQDESKPTDVIHIEDRDSDQPQIEDLKKMKVKDLVLLCKAKGIKGYSGKKKDILIQLLTR